MKILIGEDDLTSRLFMKKYLSRYGNCDVAVNGLETIELFEKALKENSKYDLVCLDIMMPKINGLKTLKEIRNLEKKNKVKTPNAVKIIMTTALNDEISVKESYENGCTAYAWKPINIAKFDEVLKTLGLV